MASSSTSAPKGARRDGKSDNSAGGSPYTAATPPPPVKSTTAQAQKSNSSPHPSHDEIARRAYQIYEEEGCQPGREVEYWLRAEAELGITRARS